MYTSYGIKSIKNTPDEIFKNFAETYQSLSLEDPGMDFPKKLTYNLAGTDKKDIKIELKDKVLRVSTEKGGLRGNHQLRDYDDVDNIKAKYNNGLLEITIKKLEPESRTIEIE